MLSSVKEGYQKVSKGLYFLVCLWLQVLEAQLKIS